MGENIDNKIYMGIDPGGDGCITWMDQKHFLDFEFLKDLKIGKEWDLNGLKNFFKEFEKKDIHVVLEGVNCDPQWTAKTNWSLSRCLTMLETIMSCYNIPYTLIKPRVWQKEMFQGVSEIRKPSKVNKNGVTVRGRLDTKKMSILAAQRLFPNVTMKKPLKNGKWSKNYHDGKTDSVLMCEYCKRHF